MSAVTEIMDLELELDRHLAELELRLEAASLAYDAFRSAGIRHSKDLRLLDRLRKRRDELIALLIEIEPTETR